MKMDIFGSPIYSFECSYILAIAIAALASARMKTIHIIMLLAILSLVCYVVEHTNIKAELLQYTGSTETVFTISGWILMMIVCCSYPTS